MFPPNGCSRVRCEVTALDQPLGQQEIVCMTEPKQKPAAINKKPVVLGVLVEGAQAKRRNGHKALEQKL